MTASQHTRTVRSAFPHVPNALDAATEARLMGRLSGWRARIDAARADYAGGYRIRQAALAAAPMNELESRAAGELYATVVGVINRAASAALAGFGADGGKAAGGTTIEDLCQEGYGHLVLALSTYDPSRGTLPAWVSLTATERYRTGLISAGRQVHARAEDLSVPSDEADGTSAGETRALPDADSWEPCVDHAAIALAAAGDDACLQALVARLFAQAGTPTRTSTVAAAG